MQYLAFFILVLVEQSLRPAKSLSSRTPRLPTWSKMSCLFEELDNSSSPLELTLGLRGPTAVEENYVAVQPRHVFHLSGQGSDAKVN